MTQHSGGKEESHDPPHGIKRHPTICLKDLGYENPIDNLLDFHEPSEISNSVNHSKNLPSLRTTLKKDLTQAASSRDMKPKSSFEKFIPNISVDDSDDETYLFQCSSAGLYQCSVTGLVFDMQGEGDVVYRTVPWNRRLLAQHHKKPAGPLFDIKCQQQSVCQLHLPHSEVISTGGGQFMQVAHVDRLEDIEFIIPHQITENHVVINITGFSGYGIVRGEDSPCDPVQALILLFYKPPVDPHPRSVLSVLLVPGNVVIRHVLRTRRELVGEEMYIDTPSRCSLFPKQVYTLSTAPDDDLIVVQPNEAEFHEEYFNSSVPSFQLIFNRVITDVNLSLTHQASANRVWKSEVCLLPNRVRTLSLPRNERLLNVRRSFINGISGPVLSSLLDTLLENMVITDAEREEANVMPNKSDRARFVIDTVRNKGERATSQMIESLCELDFFFCEHLGLI